MSCLQKMRSLTWEEEDTLIPRLLRLRLGTWPIVGLEREREGERVVELVGPHPSVTIDMVDG
jgi:hypothetical protein